MGRRKTPHRGFLSLLILVILAAGCIGVWRFSLEKRKVSIQEAIANIKSEYEFADLKILQRKENSTSFFLTLLTSETNKVFEKGFELPGKDVFISSKVIVIEAYGEKKAFVFPQAVYSDVIPEKEGFSLIPYYVENNFPRNYFFDKENDDFVDLMRKVYRAADSGNEESRGWGKDSFRVVLILEASLHQADFKPFEEGRVYKLVLHPNGGLEIAGK
jgi:hypothetical protein